MILLRSYVGSHILFYNRITPLSPYDLSNRATSGLRSFLFEAVMAIRKHIDAKKILERDLYICAYCLGDATEVEHVVPWSWTHNDDEDNLVASCRDCNSIAGGRIFGSFDEKRAYILTMRSGRKWTRKLAIKYQVFRCSTCHIIFEPLKDGATNFLCPKCTKREYDE